MADHQKDLRRPSQLGTLNKSVAVLAIEPRSMALSATARKMYNVLIRLGQMQTPDEDGFYRVPLSSVIQFAGSSTKIASRLQVYIDQMVQTTVLLHLVSESDARTLPLEGFAPAPVAEEEMRDGEERRTFPLLAEVRWAFASGRHELAWCFPPTIRDMLLQPDRWAQIEFTSLVGLTTYTSVALYEILARFKDAPGGLTARHPPEWWTRILREGGPGVKPREWRKFKSELLLPAVKEINAGTELEAELVEHRERGAVCDVQFKVSRRPARPAPAAAEAVDVGLPLRASALGVRHDEIEQAVQTYGAMKVAEALDSMESAMVKPGQEVMRPGAYLKKILANKYPVPGQGGIEVLSAAERPRAQSRARDRQERVEAWLKDRYAELEAEFAELSPQQQAEIIELAGATLPNSPGVRRRVTERDWRSPMIRRAVLGHFASDRYGPGWNTPSAGDLDSLPVGERTTLTI